MVEVDLHMHTTFSDGNLSPKDLVTLCAGRGLKVIAITDHDSTEGISEAMSAAEGLADLTVIAGVELSTDVPRSEIHVLGYYLDPRQLDLQRDLKRMRDGREKRAQRMVERLDSIGVRVSWERVQELSGGGAIGRPHIAAAMVEKGYVRTLRDAFDEYIGRNGPAYVERVKLTPVDAVQMLVNHGALPVMAHPIYSMTGDDAQGVAGLKSTLSDLKEAGLVGMEVYYGRYSPEQVDLLARMAEETGLIPCGGSDYHKSGDLDEPEPGSAGPPMATVEKLESLRRRHAPAGS